MTAHTAHTRSNEARPHRRRLWLLVRVLVTAGALGWTLSQLTWDELSRALGRITPPAIAGAAGLILIVTIAGTVRWRLLLGSYGAVRVPSFLDLTRIYLVGFFYNTFLPANVGGDVLRGYVTRDAFPAGAGAYLVVLVERLFGLAGLLVLASTAMMVRPVWDTPVLPWVAAVSLLGAAAAAAIPLAGRRIAPLLPGRLSQLAQGLPLPRRPMLLLAVLGLSVATHGTTAVAGHLLVASVAPTVTLPESFAVVPLALAAMYFPTIAGLGAREAAFVVLFGTLGVAEADATAGSLGFFAVQLSVAALGGLVHLLAPLSPEG